ncbi:MAG: glycerophosphodiester phosphodiesterase family protein [Bacteroidota bacterium]
MSEFLAHPRIYGKYFLLLLLPFLLPACRSESTSATTKTQIVPVAPGSFDFATPAELRDFLRWSPAAPVLISAHRGGPYPGYPENSIAAFENAIQYGPLLIECDVAMTKDSVLVLLHDKTLDRTTTGKGPLARYRYRELDAFRLVDERGAVTDHRIPTLTEVLNWGRGKVIFTLDVKGVPLDLVIQKVQQLDAQAHAIIITYNYRDAQTVHRLDPELVISVSGRHAEDLQRLRDSGIPSGNVMAFVGVAEREPQHYRALHGLGIRATLGTLGNLDKRVVARKKEGLYLEYYQRGADVLATDRPLEVARVLRAAASAAGQ